MALSLFRPRCTGQFRTACLLLTAVATLASHAWAQAAPAGSDNPLFRRVVFLGDSLTAGYQNGSVLDAQQRNGWAPLLARQAGFPITLPLIASPGIAPALQLVQAGMLPIETTLPGSSTGRENPDAQATDLAVPGALLVDLATEYPNRNPFAAAILTNPGNSSNQLQEAITLQPSLILLWIGSNDVINAEARGDLTQMTPVATFASEFATLMQVLHANTGARLVVGNLPDVTLVPSLLRGAEALMFLGYTYDVPQAYVSQLFGFTADDVLTAQGKADLAADVAWVVSGHAAIPLPATDILTPAQIAAIRARIDAFNSIIAGEVHAYGDTMVDLHALFNQIGRQGVSINGYQASLLAFGGIVSLDGVHPTNTGYALVANTFIDAMNASLPVSIPDVDVPAVAAVDPLFGPNMQSSQWAYTEPGDYNLWAVGTYAQMLNIPADAGAATAAGGVK